LIWYLPEKKRNPTLTNVGKLVDALGVKKSDLFDLIDKK